MHFVIKRKWKPRPWAKSNLFDTRTYLDLSTPTGRKTFCIICEENGGKNP